MSLTTTFEKVKVLLRNCPELRDNDDLLYIRMAEDLGLNNMTFGTVFTNRKELGLPPFETVRRARQKAQAEDETLRGNRYDERQELEKDFREFAKS